MPDLNDLKRETFFTFLEEAGRAFIHVRHSGNVKMGRRGFLPGEKEKGIVLVFNKGMNFTWDDSGIHATLLFSSAPEKCFIPPEDIVSVYSPELGAQLLVSPAEDAGAGENAQAEGNVIKVDFKKKR